MFIVDVNLYLCIVLIVFFLQFEVNKRTFIFGLKNASLLTFEYLKQQIIAEMNLYV